MTYLYWPSTWESWKNVLVLHLAALVGFVTHPLVWAVSLFNPAVYLMAIGATAGQESDYSATAAGDDGDSVGLLQFNVNTWPDLTGRELADRTSPWWSGYYAAAYVQDALLASWLWWPLLMIPVFRIAAYRHLWTHGASASSAESAWSESWSDETSIGNRTWPAYRFWLLVFGAPALVIAGMLVVLLRRAWRGRK